MSHDAIAVAFNPELARRLAKEVCDDKTVVTIDAHDKATLAHVAGLCLALLSFDDSDTHHCSLYAASQDAIEQVGRQFISVFRGKEIRARWIVGRQGGKG